MDFRDPHVLPALHPQFPNVHMYHASTSRSCSSQSLHPTSPYLPESPSPSQSTPPSKDIAMFHPSTSTDLSLSNIDHIASLERALCSNFTCCGIMLPDLHALIEHCEENHIPVQSRNGKPVFLGNVLRSLALCTPPPSLSSTPSSSRSSSTVSSPISISTPLSSPNPFVSSDSSPKKHHSLPPLCSTLYTPFAHLPPVDPLSFSPEDDYGLCGDLSVFSNPPSGNVYLDDIETDHLVISEASSHDSPLNSTHGPSGSAIDVEQEHGIFDIANETGNLKNSENAYSSDGAGPSHMPRKFSKSGKNKSRLAIAGYNVGNGRRREKSYRCPTVGCTKTYLNPNGLKYHMEKGTCKIEDISSPSSDSMSANDSKISRSLSRKGSLSPNAEPQKHGLGPESHDYVQNGVTSAPAQEFPQYRQGMNSGHVHDPQPAVHQPCGNAEQRDVQVFSPASLLSSA